MTRQERINRLIQKTRQSILVIDGAMGTMLQQENLSDEDFGGPALSGCNENLVLTKPAVITKIHHAYLSAGADIIETNTFGATPLVLDEYAISDRAESINRIAAQLARSAADTFGETDLRFVAGSMGPTTKAISVTGGVTFESLISNYLIQAKALHEGGVDYFLIETAQDTRNVKAALCAIEDLFKTHERIPVAVSCTIEPMGTMLAGQSIEAFWASLSHLDLLYIGLNCATGPSHMIDSIRSLSQWSQFPIACVPNAGLPDEMGKYIETPQMMCESLDLFLKSGWVNILGGCCGTSPEYIRAFKTLSLKHQTRLLPAHQSCVLSGMDFVEVKEDERPLLVGERTNVIGSRKFKSLIEANEFESASEIARKQIKMGAQVIDVCMANPDRDELSDIEAFLEKTIRMVKAPLMIDSTDPVVIERALRYCQGRSIINSINLEDGEERFEQVVPMAKRYGAALVVGTIDEDPDQGMGVTCERKIQITSRSFELLTKKYGVLPQDIFWDYLVFPCGTGDENYKGSAIETIAAIAKSKTKFPQTKTILGVSNVSFGLPNAGREILNSVFLFHCVQAGLDAAIVNTEALRRYPSISDIERKLSEDLLWNKGPDPIAAFADYFRDKKSKKIVVSKSAILEERLSSYILEGSKEGLSEDLTLALKKYTPLEVINGPLMKGMDEVGRLFNQNKLIVAEVLQSAESMKAAVSFLEPFMEKSEASLRGKILLATVKGDVHDIGKNLVDIILSNNGFEVINLGIKIPSEQLIAAYHQHKPDFMGLSGLLVKSAQQMVSTAQDLSLAGIEIPMLVGGAALSRNFVDKFISPAYKGFVEYASDAMNGLELAKSFAEKPSFDQLKQKVTLRREALGKEVKPSEAPKTPSSELKSNIKPQDNPPLPPDFERHVLTDIPLDFMWNYINPKMLLGRHLGIKNSSLTSDVRSEGIEKTLQTLDEIKQRCKKENLLQPKAVYQFLQAHSEGNTLHLSGPQKISWVFPRQNKAPHLCISDFVAPTIDNVCLFAVTAGSGVRALAEELKQSGRYLESHVLMSLALETAEATAEWLHQTIRRAWGLSENLHAPMSDLFQAKYTGKRYSFGYPACPDLSFQTHLFQCLQPEEIGITLTDGYMMDPEASVSALVISHPDASYFHA